MLRSVLPYGCGLSRAVTARAVSTSSVLRSSGRPFAISSWRAAKGSWRNCEKVSDTFVRRHPGSRCWNDLLGQRAQCSNCGFNRVAAGPTGTTTVAIAGHGSPSAESADAANSVSGNAACDAAASTNTDAAFADSGHYGSGIGFENGSGWSSGRSERRADFHRYGGEAG